MDYQILLNSAFGALMLVMGWIMKIVFDAITELRTQDNHISNQISDLAVELPKNYVHKNDFKDLTESLFRKLDRIEDKIDSKADKDVK